MVLSMGQECQSDVKPGWWVVGNLRLDQGEQTSMSTRTYDGPPLHHPATYAHGFPYDVFRELRDHDPVSHHDHPAWPRGYWAVTRHADVQRVSRDWNGFRNAPNPFLPGDGELVDEIGGSSLLMISLDPPDHTKLRKLIISRASRPGGSTTSPRR